jgi:hypothetical protein
MYPPGKHGGLKPTAPVRQIHGKFQNVPKWATPDTVLGYTYEFALNAEMVRALKEGKFSGTPYPTVYYRHGHRTVKHKIAGNVGWEGKKRQWLFFGNVHDEWLDHDYWKDQNHTGSKLGSDEKKAFAKQLRDAAAGTKQSQSFNISTSYFDPDTNSWVTQPHHGEGVLSFNKARLLEIYYDSGRLSSHPSRNRFRWAETGLRPLLHDLAVEGV